MRTSTPQWRVTPSGVQPLVLLALLAGCASEPSLQGGAVSTDCAGKPAERLLEAHQRARTAHLEGDAEALARASADQLLSAQGGELTLWTREEVQARFSRVFDTVEYRRWEDTTPPRVAVSDDGSQGWMAIRIVAELRQRGTENASWQRFYSSWIATYARLGCEWRMTAIASAVVPAENEQ